MQAQAVRKAPAHIDVQKKRGGVCPVLSSEKNLQSVSSTLTARSPSIISYLERCSAVCVDIFSLFLHLGKAFVVQRQRL